MVSIQISPSTLPVELGSVCCLNTEFLPPKNPVTPSFTNACDADISLTFRIEAEISVAIEPDKEAVA